jgi:hypothetical protein
MAKRAGRKSQQQNDFLQPMTPINVVGTNVGTGRAFNDGAVSVAFELPAGSPAATGFTIVALKNGTTADTTATNLTGSSSPIIVGGLDSATGYTFTVTAANAVGSSSASTASSSVTVTTVPQAPQAVSVTSITANQDRISWTNGATGGSAITATFFTSSDQVTNPGNVTMTTNPWNEPENGGSTQNYTLFHTNANGNSAGTLSGNVTTVSPFFPPFFPPGFGPFFPPGFGPTFRCIEENTLIDTPRGLVAAKDIRIGEPLYAVSIAELDTEQRATRDFNIGPTFTLTNLEPVKTIVTVIKISMKSEIIYFNENYEAKFSNQHTMFAKVDGQYVTKSSGELKIGDYLLKIKEDGSYVDEEITSIDTLNISSPVYEFSCEPYHWFIAGGYLVHNYK